MPILADDVYLFPFWLLSDIGQDAAVHIKDMPIDEVGGVGCQEHGGAHQVIGLPPAGRRGL